MGAARAEKTLKISPNRAFGLQRNGRGGPGHDDLIAQLPAHTFRVRISATRIGGTHGFWAQATPLRATWTSSR